MIEIIRDSYFNSKGLGKTLVWEQHSPGRICVDHVLCGCTNQVAKRPEGKPDRITQQIEIKVNDSKAFSLRRNELTVKFWKERRPEDEAARVYKYNGPDLYRDPQTGKFIERPRRDQTYFDFTNDNVLNLQVPIIGYGSMDVFFGHIYFGNEVDISRLYNGWLPSEVVDLDKLRPDDIWVHNCTFGHEVMQVFPRGTEEAERWKRYFKEVGDLLALTKEAREDTDADVHRLRADLESHGFAKLAIDFMNQLEASLVDFKQSMTFQLCDEVLSASWAAYTVGQ